MATADRDRYLGNLQAEIDGAALYRVLAELESGSELAPVYTRMAETEERHAELWRTKLRELGVTDVPTQPGWRTRTLMLTMLTYALGTAACAFAPNLWVLALFRFVASLGIGGEWAAGASLVAETMPKDKRILGGALLYTSAPIGMFLATLVNDLFTRQLESLASDPSLSWRVVFLTGLVPAGVAALIRRKVKEPEAWKPSERVELRELFTPALRKRTLGGLAMAVIALVTWWSCTVFIPVIASFLAAETSVDPSALAVRKAAAPLSTMGGGSSLGTPLMGQPTSCVSRRLSRSVSSTTPVGGTPASAATRSASNRTRL